MAKVRLSPAARKDLIEIRLYSNAQFGPGVANDYFRGFNDIFALLRRHPLAGAIAVSVGESFRVIGQRSLNIYYSFEIDTVLIVRILHRARDAGAALN